MFSTRVDCLDRDAKTSGNFLRRNSFALPRTNKGYFLVGKLALDCTGGGMMENRFLGRLVLVDIVRINIDG
ncbi:MAG: hypothetical protein IKZ72_07045 [Bacteroidales bacterium]|nr:hypothetical protein [Bacteroidales bacterium]